ncbi:MAG: HEPN domain-containing protein [Chloroflexi bacterium]|nr:HEPN domain-containing protein [Chloroflexota bacterium]MBI4314337.1 HEPN domain-containing protein [Chloroflexota bacterium]MBI5290548.1 HEPN domain-containing protein [Chloroflexota bacterium]
MDEPTQTRVRHWLQRAEEYIRTAELEFNGESYARSISTAYYAMFYAATGALASIGIERSKHSGVISAFGEYFVKAGKISGEFGRILNQTMEDREESDYAELPVVDSDLAKQHLEESKRLLESVRQYLTKQGLSLE